MERNVRMSLERIIDWMIREFSEENGRLKTPIFDDLEEVQRWLDQGGGNREV